MGKSRSQYKVFIPIESGFSICEKAYHGTIVVLPSPTVLLSDHFKRFDKHISRLESAKKWKLFFDVFVKYSFQALSGGAIMESRSNTSSNGRNDHFRQSQTIYKNTTSCTLTLRPYLWKMEICEWLRPQVQLYDSHWNGLIPQYVHYVASNWFW